MRLYCNDKLYFFYFHKGISYGDVQKVITPIPLNLNISKQFDKNI